MNDKFEHCIRLLGGRDTDPWGDSRPVLDIRLKVADKHKVLFDAMGLQLIGRSHSPEAGYGDHTLPQTKQLGDKHALHLRAVQTLDHHLTVPKKRLHVRTPDLPVDHAKFQTRVHPEKICAKRFLPLLIV